MSLFRFRLVVEGAGYMFSGYRNSAVLLRDSLGRECAFTPAEIDLMATDEIALGFVRVRFAGIL